MSLEGFKVMGRYLKKKKKKTSELQQVMLTLEA